MTIAGAYTDEELSDLKTMPKTVTNPGARWLTKPKARPAHRQRTFQAEGAQDQDVRFSIYLRQSLADESDFSCGISYQPVGGPPLTLARYNGPSHEHGDIAYRAHIHRATESAIATGKRPESQAEESNRFETLDGALACLIQDFNLTGLNAQPDKPRLFK